MNYLLTIATILAISCQPASAFNSISEEACHLYFSKVKQYWKNKPISNSNLFPDPEYSKTMTIWEEAQKEIINMNLYYNGQEPYGMEYKILNEALKAAQYSPTLDHANKLWHNRCKLIAKW